MISSGVLRPPAVWAAITSVCAGAYSSLRVKFAVMARLLCFCELCVGLGFRGLGFGGSGFGFE